MADPLAPDDSPAAEDSSPLPPTDRRRPISATDRRRGLATSLWLAGAILLGGLDLPARGYEAFQFAPFGIVAGLLGMLFVFVLSNRGVIWLGEGWIRALLLVYWVAATAMVFRVLLPPPGLVQVFLAFSAAVAAAIVVSQEGRERAVLWVGIMAVTLAVLRFALVPAFGARSELPNWGPFQFGEAADSFREFFVAYAPQRPAAQALHFGALVGYALALWVQWDRPRD
ncbi:MAG TPA: hypothetical protein VM737_09925 [Gemmatimonadota bacterium]|nr:hypothetical protein [Gemmatimonadota bacterium]